MFKDKRVVLGVTGGIAAYKAAEIARLLVKRGAIVRVVMTEAATRFVAPLTFETITGRSVLSDVFERDTHGGIYHIDEGKEADVILVAPATANTIARLAAGIADDLLSSLVLAADAPIVIAPSMNCRMYRNYVTQRNLRFLKECGHRVIEPAKGWLACGEEDVGRLPDPLEIVERVGELLVERQDLAGKTVLVTAGGTREPLDPVRYVGNRSSGLMGLAIAEALVRRGSRVIMVAASVSYSAPFGVEVMPVTTADEMLQAVLQEYDNVDAVVMTAAVADFKPKRAEGSKIKKGEREELLLELEPTTDILKELAARRRDQVLVGFAAETDNVVTNARRKLSEKKLDTIVANDVSREGVGFASDKLDAVILGRDGAVLEMGVVDKREVARVLVGRIAEALAEKRSSTQ